MTGNDCPSSSSSPTGSKLQMFSKILNAMVLALVSSAVVVAQPAPLRTEVPADAVGVISYNSTETRDVDLEKVCSWLLPSIYTQEATARPICALTVVQKCSVRRL